MKLVGKKRIFGAEWKGIELMRTGGGKRHFGGNFWRVPIEMGRNLSRVMVLKLRFRSLKGSPERDFGRDFLSPLL